MPLKLAALDVGRPDELAAQVGAANTLVFDHSSGMHRVHNTDVDGMVNAVRAAGVDRIGSAVLLGGGGTARAALASLSRLGARRVTLVLRTVERAEPLRPLADALGVELTVQHWSEKLPAVDLVVSTAVAGAADALGRASGGRCAGGVRRDLRPLADRAVGGRRGTWPGGAQRARPAGPPGRAAVRAVHRPHPRSRDHAPSGAEALPSDSAKPTLRAHECRRFW